MNLSKTILGWALLAAVSMPVGALQRYALLIGISDYRAERKLEGPGNDVEALRQTLIERGGFRPEHITVLKNGRATRAAVTQALAHLVEVSAPGDHVFIYYSGHGISAQSSLPDRSLTRLLPACSGALVPADYADSDSERVKAEKLIIGRRDLFPSLERLDQSGRRVFVAFDTCYAGQTYRGGVSAAETGNAGGRPKFVRGVLNMAPKLQPGKMCSGSPYQHVFFLSASTEATTAKDVTEREIEAGYYRTVDGKPHGAMTDAMLSVLSGRQSYDYDHNGLQYSELVNGIQQILDQKHVQQTVSYTPRGVRYNPAVNERWVFEKKMTAAETAPHPLKIQPLRVKLNSSDPRLAQRIDQIPGLTVAADRDIDLSLVDRGGRRDLYDGNGALIKSFASGQTAALLKALRQQIVLLDGIGRRPGRAPINVWVELKDRPGNLAREGDLLHFVVRSGRAAQLLVLAVDPAGGVQLGYPDISDYPPVRCDLERDRACQLPELEVIGPEFGSEYLVAIAFTRPYPKLAGLVNRAKLKNRLSGADRMMQWDEPELQDLLVYLQDHPGRYRSATFTVLTEANQ